MCLIFFVTLLIVTPTVSVHLNWRHTLRLPFGKHNQQKQFDFEELQRLEDEEARMHSRTRPREDQIIPEPNLEACPGPIWFTFTLIVGATTELYDQTKVLLRKSFITGVSSLSPQMIRSILQSKYFGPTIEKILPVAKFPIPANFHDDVNGIFLRLVLSQDDGMMNLEMIALVARHLHVVRHDGQIDYYVSMFRLMLEGGKRFCKDRSGLMRKKMAAISASLHRDDPKSWVHYPRRAFKSDGKCFGHQEPDNVHDMARGYWLRLVKSSREGELFVALIKAVGNNVRVEYFGGTPHYFIDFLGLNASPGINHFVADVPGLKGELQRRIAAKGGY